MSKRMYFRWTWVLTVAVLFTFVSVSQLCAGGTGAAEKVTEKPTISFLFDDWGRVKWSPDTYLIKEFAHRMGDVDLELVPVPTADFDAKVRALIASRQVPDLLKLRKEGLDMTKEFGPRGVFFPVDTKFDMTPNLNKFRKEYPDYDKIMKASDGHQYGYSVIRNDGAFSEVPSFSPKVKEFGIDPQKDIKTFDDLYRALKTCKQNDPKVYPWVERRGMRAFYEKAGAGYWTQHMFLNPNTGKYVYGAIEENYRLLLEFLAKCYGEGLLHPDFFTMQEEPWRELLNEAYFTIDSVYVAAVEVGVWIPILAPEFYGKRYWTCSEMQPIRGTPYVINAECKYIDNHIEFVDWLYSKEGTEFCYFGKVGEVSERMPDGLLRYIPKVWEENDDIPYALGVRAWQMAVQYNPPLRAHNPHLVEQAAGDKASFEYQREQTKKIWDSGTVMPVQPELSFTDQEKDRVKQLQTPIDTFADENTMKFVLGQKPLSEWNDYVTRIEKMGVDELVGIYQTAYERFIK